ncbi:MAG: CYTH domain-containing protein [Bacteroidaceae bacterium]|nr:CYTH domain-containing protein [Bacteroidaceae bacterium]
MAHREIERKFLVTGEWKPFADSKTHIEQGYFATEPGRTVRVRIRDEKGYLTIKGPTTKDGLARYEFETEIPLEDAHEMMKLCMPGRVDKDRYLIKNGKHVIEVDEFFGENEGLVVAEIELDSEDEAYEKPDFLGKEVTGDFHYYNKYMLRRPYKLWKDEVAFEQSDDATERV